MCFGVPVRISQDMAITNQGKRVLLPIFLHAVAVSPQSEGVRGRGLF